MDRESHLNDPPPNDRQVSRGPADHRRAEARKRVKRQGRNVIEHGFNDTEQWRGLASRYDKHALVYRGSLVLASIVIWLR